MSEGFVSIPVPVDRVDEVYRLLAEPPVEELDEDEFDEGWTEELLQRLASGRGAANERAAAIMDVLVTEPGARFSMTDLVEATEYTREQLRGGLSALTRHLNKHYGRIGWPFVFVWGPDEDLGSDEAYYYMEEEMAVLWTAVRD